MASDVTAVILAAGYGKRMKSSLPKVLHPLCGLPMIEHSLRAVAKVTSEPPVLVVGHGADQVKAAVGARARFAVQVEQLGTAHALQMAEPLLKDKKGLVLLTTGDMPLLTSTTLQRLVDTQRGNTGPMSMLTVVLEDSHGFGRVVRSADGSVREIIEEAQASPAVLALNELNASVYCFQADWLWQALRRVERSPKGEYYLTDMAGIAVADGLRVEALSTGDPQEALGINTREHLAEAEAVMRARINRTWMEAGVTITDPRGTYIEVDVQIGPDSVIYPGSSLQGQTVVGRGCQIGPQAVIINSHLGDGCRVEAAWLEGCTLEKHQHVPAYRRMAGEQIDSASAEKE